MNPPAPARVAANDKVSRQLLLLKRFQADIGEHY